MRPPFSGLGGAIHQDETQARVGGAAAGLAREGGRDEGENGDERCEQGDAKRCACHGENLLAASRARPHTHVRLITNLIVDFLVRSDPWNRGFRCTAKRCKQHRTVVRRDPLTPSDAAP